MLLHRHPEHFFKVVILNAVKDPCILSLLLPLPVPFLATHPNPNTDCTKPDAPRPNASQRPTIYTETQVEK